MDIIKNLLPEVQENVLLAPYTTFNIGGNAKYFFTAKTKEDIIKAVKAGQQCGLSFFILAKGSNVLFPDNGFNGLVIKLQTTKNELRNDVIYSEAGVMLLEIVNKAAEAALSGLEWASGIPGTVGGAVRGNAGAFDASMSNIVKKVEVLDISDLELKNYEARDCEFGYRNSIFKKNKNLIVLSTEIKLQKEDKEKIEKQMKECRDYRIEHHPLEFPSAGSIFKNLSLGDFRPEIFIKYPELNNFREQQRVPASFLIEKSGLKGENIGDAQISEKHCNFIINLGKATAKDVLALIKLAKEKVKEDFGIELEEEIVIPS
jgi:UDP-N-acetylmuramate dehydrogenase